MENVNEIKGSYIVEQHTHELSKEVPSAVNQDHVVKQATSEMQARMDRKNNIVFFNIVKPPGNINDNVRPQERASVFEICKHLGIDIESYDLINCKRIRKKRSRVSMERK